MKNDCLDSNDEYWSDQIKDIAECCLIQLHKLDNKLTSTQYAEIDGMKDDLELIISVTSEVINDK